MFVSDVATDKNDMMEELIGTFRLYQVLKMIS